MKRIPHALLLGLGVQLGFLIVEFAYVVITKSYGYSEKWSLTVSGVAFLYKVLGIYGLLELGRGRTGWVAVGVKIAVAGFALDIAASLGYAVLSSHEQWLTARSVAVLAYAYSSAVFAIVVGLAIASRVALPLAIGAIVVVVVGYPPPILARPLWHALDLGLIAGEIARFVLEGIRIAVLVALAAAACRDRIASPDPQRAIAGLRRASNSFWLRLFAALAIPGATLLLAVASTGHDATDLMRVALMGAAILGAIAMLLFALGAVAASQAGVVDLGGITLLVGGALALWCTGVVVEQLPDLYRMLYGQYEHHADNRAQDFAVVLPFVGIAAITVVVTAIHRFATRRGGDELVSRATSSGAWFVAFSLTAVAVQAWLLPKTETASGAVILLLILAGCGIVTNVAMARLCEAAAGAMDREPGLPTATVVSGPA